MSFEFHSALRTDSAVERVMLPIAYSQIFCCVSRQVKTTLESLLTGRTGP